MADMHGGHGGDLAPWLIAKGATALGGLAGAFVANLFPPYKPWRDQAAEYIGGALTAVYVGPTAGPLLYNAIVAACGWLGIPPAQSLPQANVESLAGFLCGVLGLTIIRGLLKLARRWARDPKLPWPPAGP